MRKYAIKYGFVVASILFFFANFIACGSQFYQVTMKDDFDEEQLSQEALDPDSQQYGIHALNGWHELPVSFRFGQNLTAAQQKALKDAMKSWEDAVGQTLFAYQGVHTGVTGDSFGDLYSSLDDRINGNYLDQNWQKTKKPTVVLATTIWNNLATDRSQIAGADIRFNDQNYLIGDSLYMAATDEKEIVDMESLALHELGHLLGLSHVDADVDPNSIMNPSLYIGEGLISRKISRGDILRIQKIYGCEELACDVDKVVESIELNKTPGLVQANAEVH